MHAAYIEQFGPPEAIRYGELPDPEPGPTDVLVAVDAVAVNNVDTFVRSGAWRTPVPLPLVVGRDLVGTVLSAGPGAHRFRPGDRVWCNSLGHDGRQGAAAERAVVPADRLYPLAPGADPLEVVAVAHGAATAHLGLFPHGRLRAGETVVVIGAAGNVGGAAVVLAARAGARVVAVAAGRDAGYCRALGAAEAVDRDGGDLAEALRAAAPDGVGLWLDAAGVNDLGLAVDLMARRGRAVLLAGMRTRPELPVGPLYLKDCSVHGFAISHAGTAELAGAAAAINRLTAEKALSVRAVETLPLREAAAAHRRLEDGGVRGKLVLRTDT
ncbi:MULTISPECIES: alcohol dehydrogenase catalytic domain-containing protein [unclassified Streptomyces]|uniref:alcohol dehydrogenase catalytic domain-containing protein n=1 Tax=unclassified Streptomyces TaxID=2593676 RepID=UPI0022373996|nr:zinc-binding dehydrogenase [Streptomyces sp. SHP 1-2]MCW5253050.1 zinc-binding dehydrogenase [Streptomyces sp. SHP 1-2]